MVGIVFIYVDCFSIWVLLYCVLLLFINKVSSISMVTRFNVEAEAETRTENDNYLKFKGRFEC